jgi:hypothetical protein
MEIANSQGKPFYSFISEILEYALKVYRSGISLGDVVEFYEFMDIYQSLGAKIVSNEALNYFISKSYPKDSAILKQNWYEFGRLCGKELSVKYSKPLDVLEKFLKVKEWELNEVSIVQKENRVNVKCISSILSAEVTELLASFIDGLMHELGYKKSAEERLKGIISLEYEKA